MQYFEDLLTSHTVNAAPASATGDSTKDEDENESDLKEIDGKCQARPDRIAGSRARCCN